MKAPKTEGNYEKHPEGQFPLVCCQVVDLGTHHNPKKDKDEHKIRFMFLSDQLMTEGDTEDQPFAVFAQFNYSMYLNSHLHNFIQSWVGKSFPDQDTADNFDLSWCLAKPAYAHIVHNQGYVNIQSIMPLPAEVSPPAVKGESILFDLNSPNRTSLGYLGEKTQEIIMTSHEWLEYVETEVPPGSASESNPPDDKAPW